MAKSQRNTNNTQPRYKLTEADRGLLEVLGKFCIRAKHSTWETVNHSNEIEATMLLHEVGQQLSPYEYSALTNGWSVYRLDGDDSTLNRAVETITNRIQEHQESF